MDSIVSESALLPEREDFYDTIYCEKCQYLLKEPCWLHATIIKDEHVVPLSISSLPDVLCFGGAQNENGVCAKRTIRPHTVFGPLVAPPRVSSEVVPRPVRDSLVTGTLLAFNMDNDKWCSWMKHVSVVGNSDEQNMKVYSLGEDVIFVCVKVILPGEELRLAVGHNRPMRTCGNSSRRVTFGEVENLYRGCRSSGARDNIPLPVFALDCTLANAGSSSTVDIKHPAYSDGRIENGLPSVNDNDPLCALLKHDLKDDMDVCPTVHRLGLDSEIHSSVSSAPPSTAQESSASCGSLEYHCDRESSPEYPFPPLRQPILSMISQCQQLGSEVDNRESSSQKNASTMKCDSYLPFSEPSDDQPEVKTAVSMTAMASTDGALDVKQSRENIRIVDAIAGVDDHDEVCTRFYSLRPRVTKPATSIAYKGHSKQRQRSLSPPEEVPDDDMLDDSDVDADWVVSDTDRESSAESEEWLDCESAPPTKKQKSSDSRSEVQDRRRSSNTANVFTVPKMVAPIISVETANGVDFLDKKTVTTPEIHAAGTVDRVEANAVIRPKHVAYRGQRGCYTSDLYRFKCCECSLHFRLELLLQWHRQFQHSAKVDEPWVSRRKCAACVEVYVDEKAMTRHVEKHGVPSSRVKHFVPTADPGIMKHIPGDGSRLVVADGFAVSHETHELCFMHYAEECFNYGCALRFCSESLMNVHKMKHVPPKNYEGPLVCPGCQYQAVNPKMLFDHVGKHGAARHDRKMCGRCAEFVVDMNHHVDHNHKEEYQRFTSTFCPFVCDQCDKRCRTSAFLHTHKVQKHSVRTPQCYICAKQFPSPGLLKEHSEEHRTEAGLVCPTCQRCFLSYGDFSFHTKSHNPKHISICDVCQAVFADIGKLKEHKKIHGTDYKYHCDQCEKSFKRTCNLWQHKKQVHSDFYRKKRRERKEARQKQGIVVKYVCPRRTMRYDD